MTAEPAVSTVPVGASASAGTGAEEGLDAKVQSSPRSIILGTCLGAAIYIVWAGPYWLYVWNYSSLAESQSSLASALGPRPWFGRIISSPINLFTLVAFCVALVMLWERRRHLRDQVQAFKLELFGADEDTLILPEDALDCRKRLRQLPESERQLVLIQLLSTGLQRARANWSAEDVGAAIKNQIELVVYQIEAAYSIVRYLAWAIPSIGFIGTVMGISSSLYAFGSAPEEERMQTATGYLFMAFDTTLVALVLSVILMFFLHRVQADEDHFVARAANWCMERFVLRIHVPKGEG